MTGAHRFPYKWRKADLERVVKHGHKVFSTFACGGGSSFGYKMVGFDVVGFNEIDAEMAELYGANHHPRHSYCEPIQEFKKRESFPDELMGIDVLDGSPPCSSFSVAGAREEFWGRDKVFREGQAKQVLSDLFFDYLDVVGRLKPKVSVAENVKGMLLGKAKGYCRLVVDRYRELGYDVQLFLLNAASMGVPQTRERVFFVARRRELGWSNLRLDFKEAPVTFREVCQNLPFQDLGSVAVPESMRGLWRRTVQGEDFASTVERDTGRRGYFNFARLSWDRPAPTITGSADGKMMHPDELRGLSWVEFSLIGSYPYDYDYLGKPAERKVYCIGMSVPPVMMAQVAAGIAEQWFGVESESIDRPWREDG